MSASRTDRAANAERFLDLIGASLGAKLSADNGDHEVALARLGRVLETASVLRDELLRGERSEGAARVDA